MRTIGHIRGSTEFGPRDVAGLAIWLDASDPGTLFQDAAMTTPANGDSLPIGGWMDKSGSGRHVTQSLATKRPTLNLGSLNGRPSIRSDGVDDRLVSGAWSSSQPNTVFVVCRYDSLVLNAVIMDGTASPGRHLLYLSGSPIRYIANAGTPLGTSLDADTNPHLHMVQFNGSSSTYRIDRTQLGSGNVGSDALNGLCLFSSYFVTCFAGSISELLVYNRALADSQIRSIERFLRRKWGTP